MNGPRRGSPAPAWTRPISDRLTTAVKALVIANTLLFLFYVFVVEARPLFISHLALGPGFLAGEVWQPLTALFVHVGAQAPLDFIFNVIGLWFVGALVERTTGTRRFVLAFLLAGILANITIAVSAAAFGGVPGNDGCSLSILALFVSVGRIYGRAPMQIFGALVLQARHFTYIIVGWSVLASLMRGNLAYLAGTLVAIGIGYAAVGGAPQGNVVGGLASLWDRLRLRMIRRRYRVLDGGRGGKPRFMN